MCGGVFNIEQAMRQGEVGGLGALECGGTVRRGLRERAMGGEVGRSGGFEAGDG